MRSFVAVEISEENLISSIEEFQSKIKLQAKPVNSKNFHFTLQFLGEISEERAEKIIHALEQIKFDSFTVNLKGIGGFPRLTSPRIIWIGTDDFGGEQLVLLSRIIENALKPLGLISDKSFKPHLTIFRIKKKIGDLTKELEGFKEIDFGMQRVDSVKLKKSRLTPKGSIYSDIMEIKAIK